MFVKPKFKNPALNFIDKETIDVKYNEDIINEVSSFFYSSLSLSLSLSLSPYSKGKRQQRIKIIHFQCHLRFNQLKRVVV